MSGWRKSTWSSYNTNCVEVGEDWRKPARSVGNGACVEAAAGPAGVLVRDTDDREGAVLSFPAGAWTRFLARTAGGRP